MIDRRGQVVVAEDPQAANIYSLLKFSQSVFRRYGFDQVESKKDLESKLDKAIIGLEGEIQDKRKAI